MVGKRVSHYNVLDKLGGGGMGVVYKAEDIKLHRIVALKFLPPELTRDDDAKLRFINEAQTASSLDHTNICDVHEIGETIDEQLFICMNYYEGETLKKKIQRGPLPIEQAIDIGIQISTGLQKAHEKGIIHRDIKPANIFITNDGVVKILDFGLAKLAGQTMMTRTGATIGTVAYMSPEQIRGEEVDNRTDIWSLGVIFYEMITGQLPFKGDYEQAVIYSILNLPAQPISMFRPNIDPKLESLIMDCLIKTPNERWQTVAEISHRLKNLTKSSNLIKEKSNNRLGQILTYTRLQNKLRKSFNKKSNWIYAALIIIAGLIIGLIIPPSFNKDSQIDLSKYKFTPIANDESFETSAEWSPNNKNIVYVKDVNGFDQLFLKSLNNPFSYQITAFKNENAAKPFWSPDGNLIYFIKSKQLYSVGLTGGEPKKIIDSVYAATISPDGNTIAFYRVAKLNSSDSLSLNRYKRSVYIYSLKDSSIRKYSPSPFELYGIFIPNIIHFSPDGKKIGLSIWGDEAKNVEFWILPWPDGKNKIPYKIFDDSRLSFPAAFSWFPDSRHIILSLMDRTVDNMLLGMADTESGEIRYLLPAVSDERYTGSLSPDGTKIALSKTVAKSNIISIPLDGSSPNYFLATPLGEGCISFSSDGKKSTYLTDRNGKQELWLRNSEEDIRPVLTSDDFKDIKEFSFVWAAISPDGNLIAVQVFGKNISPMIYIVPSTGGAPVRLLSGDNMEDIYSWSPDSKYLAIELTRRDKSYLAIVKVGAQEKPSLIQVLTKSAILESVLWFPDGKLISYHDGSQIIIISPDGKVKKTISSPDKDGKFRLVYSVWSKDCKSFYIVTFKGSESGVMRLYTLNIESKAYKYIAENKVDFNFNLHICLAPDGKSLIASINKIKSDIWLWEGFPQP